MKKENVCISNSSSLKQEREKQAMERARLLCSQLASKLKSFRLSPSYLEVHVLGAQHGFFKHVADGSTTIKMWQVVVLEQLVREKYEELIERYRHTKPELSQLYADEYEAWRRHLMEILLP